MFSIQYPQFLILIIPILILLFRKNKNKFIKENIFHPNTIVEDKNNRINIKLIFISTILIIIALSRPIIKETKQDINTLSSNVIFALDISHSMKCDDISPNRLDASKEILKLVAQNNTSDKFALFGFTTNTLPLSPLSFDHSLVINSLDSLNSEYILTKGTSILNLISKINSLNYNNPLVFVLSDGGEEKLKLDNSNIYPIVMATKQGSKLPMNEKFVISQANPMFTNSNVIKFDGVENTAKSISSIIKNNNKSVLSSISKSEDYELYRYFLILAISFFLFFILDIKPKVLLLLGLMGITLNAGILDFYYINKGEYCKIESFEGQYNCATSLYSKGYYTKSLKVFKSLKSNDANIKSTLFYNVGNCQYQLKDFKRAILNYRKSLELVYNNDANINLSMALFKSNLTPQMKKNTAQKEGEKKFENSNDDSNSKSSTTVNLKIVTTKENKHQLGSKSYNMINKGYIDEKQPW